MEEWTDDDDEEEGQIVATISPLCELNPLEDSFTYLCGGYFF